jgi:hypothetical protein
MPTASTGKANRGSGCASARDWNRWRTGMRQRDLALALAITLALIRGAAFATPLARRVVKTLERSLRRLRDFEQDASHKLRGLLAAIAARVVHAHGGNRCVANAAGSGPRFQVKRSLATSAQWHRPPAWRPLGSPGVTARKTEGKQQERIQAGKPLPHCQRQPMLAALLRAATDCPGASAWTSGRGQRHPRSARQNRPKTNTNLGCHSFQ